MDQKIKVDDVPFHAYRLYIKLYCEKKGLKDKKTIKRAKKSWDNLSPTNRGHFYKTSAKRTLLKYAHSLSNTKTYLQEKTPTKHKLDKSQSVSEQNEIATSNATVVTINDVTETALQPSMECDVSCHIDENQSRTETWLAAKKDEIQSNVDSDDASTVIIQLNEPTQPLNRTLINTTGLNDDHETQSNIDSDGTSTVLIQLNEPIQPNGDTETWLAATKDEIQSNVDSDDASTVIIQLNEPTQPLNRTLINTTGLNGDHETQSNVDSDGTSTVLIQLNEPTQPNGDKNVELTDTHETQSRADSDEASTVVIPPSEPIPPNLKSGKDLYEIISNPGDKTWNEISKREKSKYYHAVRCIKRDYLKQYISYLETLSKQQLYDHYMKTLY